MENSLQQVSSEDMEILAEEQERQRIETGKRPAYKKLISDAIRKAYK